MALLLDLGLLAPGEAAEVAPLTGGVSSDIFVVRAGARRFCVKFALDQLKVRETWTAPIGRNGADFAWLGYVAALDPRLVPKLHGRSERLNGFAMEFLDPARHPNWKSELLAGHIDVAFAHRVGEALGAIHARAAADPAGRAAFANQADFRALRLDPYLRFTADRHHDLAPRLRALAAELEGARISLVHGDVSPKNILCGPDGPVFLDAECAVEGDPAFDVAFCLNHLLIKALAAIAAPALLADAATALWQGYRGKLDWEPASALEARVTGLLPALMLARVDGKSPVEYLADDQRDRQRRLSRHLLDTPAGSVAELVATVQAEGERHAGR